MIFPTKCATTSAPGRNYRKCTLPPTLLKDADWDVIAECAKWSRANTDVLVDTHWVGGDPAMLEVYRLGIVGASQRDSRASQPK